MMHGMKDEGDNWTACAVGEGDVKTLVSLFVLVARVSFHLHMSFFIRSFNLLMIIK
jgi:hypothetical protein